MPDPIDRSPSRSLSHSLKRFPDRATRGLRHVGWGAACAVLLCACAPPPLAPPPPVAVAAPVPPPPAPAPAPVAPPPPPAAAAPEPRDLAARRFLAYHDQVRAMPAAELAQEVARLNVALAMATAAPAAASPVAVEAASAPVSAASSVAATPAVTTVLSFPSAPALTLELALALGQLRNNGDLARALALLEPIARSTAPELQPWQPLARLLAARYLELRRLEDQLERQAQQLRDSQRRLDQTTEKLEALKNIERSLTVRPAAGSPGSATPPRTP